MFLEAYTLPRNSEPFLVATAICPTLPPFVQTSAKETGVSPTLVTNDTAFSFNVSFS
jgi:hypothetical protein